MCYIKSLPSDLIKELSCFLNYSSTINLFSIMGSSSNSIEIIWRYKITKELNYALDKTLLPLDQKYLQLKARGDIDMGCEVFLRDLPLAYYKAAKKSDPIEREELLDYLQNLPIVQSVEQIRSCEIALLAGALEVNNKELIEEYKHYLKLDGKLLDKECLRALIYKNESSYWVDIFKLITAVYICNNEQLKDGFEALRVSSQVMQYNIFRLEVRASSKGFVLRSTDEVLIDDINNSTSVDGCMAMYIALLEEKRFKVADFLYEIKLEHNRSSLTVSGDIMDLCAILFSTDDVKYITLAKSWMKSTPLSLFQVLCSDYMVDNAHKFYNLKHLEDIFAICVTDTSIDINNNTIVQLVICNALKYGYLDFVEWIRTKIPINSISISKLADQIRKDKSRQYPDYVMKYIENSLLNTDN